jgi:hypothetical protein
VQETFYSKALLTSVLAVPPETAKASAIHSAYAKVFPWPPMPEPFTASSKWPRVSDEALNSCTARAPADCPAIGHAFRITAKGGDVVLRPCKRSHQAEHPIITRNVVGRFYIEGWLPREGQARIAHN